MDIHSQCGEEQAGQAADREEANETERIKKGRLEPNRAFVERGYPVEYFDRRGNRYEKLRIEKIMPA